MKMDSRFLVAILVLGLSPGEAPAQHTYSKAVQKACANDYKQHCGQYGIETEALRLCMDRAGQRLTKTCVDALVADGEVSKQEVERRKRSGR
jgi:adenylate kinase